MNDPELSAEAKAKLHGIETELEAKLRDVDEPRRDAMHDAQEAEQLRQLRAQRAAYEAPRPFTGPPPIAAEELANRFTYHAPTEGQPKLYETLRYQGLGFAKTIVDLTPPSREQSLALTALEEAVFWANAAIARRSS